MSALKLDSIVGGLRLFHLSARLIGGRWFWVLPVLPVLWPAYLMVTLLAGWRPEQYLPYEAHSIIALPLSVFAIGLGVRIIAGEIDRRTLEIAYTVPGGARRVWLAKLAAAAALLVVAEALLAAVTAVFLTGFPARALYGPFQAGAIYLLLSMALSALFRSEVTGALVSIPLLILGLATQGGKFSPFYTVLRPELEERFDATDLLARAVQNRIGYLLVGAALVALAFARAERREKMIGG